MSDHTHAVLAIRDHLAEVTFHTETGINVASLEFLRELEAVVDTLPQKEDVRFVTFQAQGKTFLAGANIKAMVHYNPVEARDMAELGHRVLNKVEALPQVTVAAIHATALGGGCEFAMACDFRFAVRGVNIGQPEVLLGLIPGWGGTLRLPRLIGPARAKRLILSGQGIAAERALELGLVDEVVGSAEELSALLTSFFDSLLKAGPRAVAAAKHALRTGDEIGAFAGCFEHGESKEGMGAFLEKRAAAWTAAKA